MFKTKGGAGGQRLFEQCSKKLRIWRKMAPLMDNMTYCPKPLVLGHSKAFVLSEDPFLR